MMPTLTFIGDIQTPYHALNVCPNNIDPNEGPDCTLHLHERYREGLLGLAAGQHILVLYWLGDANREQDIQQQGKHGEAIGTFALRSPHRPNPIGAAVLPIQAIDGGDIVVKGLDCLNGTPLLDIKPAIYRESTPS